jgi:hypothetical protein
MQYALALFGRHIAGIEQWEAGAGSESVDGDVITEFHNIAKAAGWIGVNGDTIFGIAPPSQSAEMRKALERIVSIREQQPGLKALVSEMRETARQALSRAGDNHISDGLRKQEETATALEAGSSPVRSACIGPLPRGESPASLLPSEANKSGDT